MKSKLLYERALITCVLMLIVSIILKLFGVPWFNLDTSIPILNTINDIVMDNTLIMSFINFVLCFINVFFVVAITTGKEIKEIMKMCIPMIVFIIIGFVIYNITKNNLFKFIYDTSMVFIICKLINRDKILVKFIIVCVLNILYQLFSMFVRSLSVQVYDNNIVISLLMNLDYYILLLMTYLYLRRCEKWDIHVFGSFLAKKLWRKPTQNLNQCSSKEM